MGPLGSPIAVHTQLGWTVQGPLTFLQQPSIQTENHLLEEKTVCVTVDGVTRYATPLL